MLHTEDAVLAISPHVDPHEQTVAENELSRIRCWVPGNPSAILTWRKHGGELPDQADDRGGILTIPRTALHDAGNYICSAQGPRGGPGVDSLPARVNVRRCTSYQFRRLLKT
ncbi:unnamed protein product [Toxocara canis]|uniref:Ig-like domain-containing protein n=1 Tax=Toxocara canis TaxID=6265 RepID=A0A183U5L3_TOXCA|nr:unnamed protein product [Toxocara canis]